MAFSQSIKRPSRARRKALLTMADAVDHLLRIEEINPNESRAVERAIMAVKSAVRNFTSHSTQGFRYYDAREHLVAEATIDLGEVEVTSNVVTPTTPPTWPSWMDYATIEIGGEQYKVMSYDSTTATISDGATDGTHSTAKLDHTFMRLPSDIRRRATLCDGSRDYPIVDVPGGLVHSWQSYYDWVRSAANPRAFASITGDERFQGELLLTLWPPYTVRKTLSLFYERYPELCEVHRYGTGTVSVTGDSTTVTASSSVFTSDHVGSMLVICVDDSTEIQKPLASQSLVQHKRVIVGVTNGTTATLDADLGSDNVTARTFYISDIIDVQPGPQVDAMLRLCEYEICRQSKSKDANNRYMEFRYQMEIAMADDSRYKDIYDSSPMVSADYDIGNVDGRPDL
jgi:hypothetical protein